VIDGDTIEIRGERIRLDAIDAPESGQLCEAGGEKWRCGQQAALALADRTGTRNVTCRDRGTDRYGHLEHLDLNGWLVSEGWALAYRRYSTEYVAHEVAAQGARRGMWRGEFVPPWEWRQGERLNVRTADQRGDCRIKGNISRPVDQFPTAVDNGPRTERMDISERDHQKRPHREHEQALPEMCDRGRPRPAQG
jgi:hypothetical protein